MYDRQIHICIIYIYFMEKSGQILLSKHDKDMISQRKSTEVVNIFWFGHTSLLLLNRKDVKRTFPLSCRN